MKQMREGNTHTHKKKREDKLEGCKPRLSLSSKCKDYQMDAREKENQESGERGSRRGIPAKFLFSYTNKREMAFSWVLLQGAKVEEKRSERRNEMVERDQNT